MIMATSMEEKLKLGLAYTFRSLVHDHCGGKSGGIQKDMILEM